MWTVAAKVGPLSLHHSNVSMTAPRSILQVGCFCLLELGFYACASAVVGDTGREERTSVQLDLQDIHPMDMEFQGELATDWWCC